MIAEFRKWLIKQNLSENTVNSYTFTVEHYFSIYKEVNKENLLTYKGFLVQTYKGKTVNLRIQDLNKYLEYIGQSSDRLKFVKIQQKNFLEKYNDIALLADLMGHESSETTRIYLRRTSEEQRELIDKIITW